MGAQNTTKHQTIMVQAPDTKLKGDLTVPERSQGIVVFAHGSGSSRLSPRNQIVAEILNHGGLATLLFDLLTAEEHRVDQQTRELRFDIELLARRLTGAVDWVHDQREVGGLPIGLFGASTGAAAALIAAAQRPELVSAIVSRGGRPDLAGEALPQVRAPTLLIVGGFDSQVIDLNEQAARSLAGEKHIEIVPEASHLFEEPGKLDEVARLAQQWFTEKLQASA